MDDKLKLFLEKININDEYKKYFEHGKIIKIKCSKDKLNWNFYIETENLLPIEVLDFLDNNIKKGFENLNDVSYTIFPKEKNNLKINDYFSYVLNNIGLSKGILAIFSKDSIRFTTNGIVLAVTNRAEENVIKNNLDKINKKFNQIGFDVNLKVELTDEEKRIEKNNDIKIDVDMSKIVVPRKKVETNNRNNNPIASTKKVENSTAILGKELSGDITEITLVNGEMDNVTIEGYIFGIDLFDSSKYVYEVLLFF